MQIRQRDGKTSRFRIGNYKPDLKKQLIKLCILLGIVIIAWVASCTGLTEDKAVAYIDGIGSYFAKKDEIVPYNAPKVIESMPPQTISPALPSPIPDTLFDTVDYANKFNQYRESQGLKPLKFTTDLNRIAELRLLELMMDYSHDSIGNYNKYLAENILMGMHDNLTGLKCWQESALHRLNMLNSDYINTGYASNGYYAVQVFSEFDTVDGLPQLPPGWYFNE